MAAFAALATASQAAIITWDDGAADDYWSSGDNWSGTPDNTAPVNGDSVVLTATPQSRLDYAWTIVSGASLTSTTSGFGDELDLEGPGSVLTLATGGTMDIGFMRPRFSSGGQFTIEPGASLDTDVYGLGTVSADIKFIADASGVTQWNNSGDFDPRLDNLILDLSSYDIANGTTLVLVDYGTLTAGYAFSSVSFVDNVTGTIDYGYDIGGGDLAIALININESVPTDTSNGTPYSWLDLYGLVTGGNYEAADLLDSDGDGLLNWEEYQKGTGPTGGVPVEDIVVDFERGTGGAPHTLTFMPPDTEWILEASTGLEDWGVLPIVTFVTNGDGSITASAAHEALDSSSRGYFRVVQLGTNDTLVIFLTEGQSNMVGSSSDWSTNIYGIGDLPLRNMFQLSRGHPRAFYDPGAVNDVIRAYQPLQMTQTHSAWETRRYDSLDFYFARAYAENNPDHDVLIVKNAVGGTGFRNNRWNAGDDLDLLVTPYLQAALAQVSGNYATIRFGGILWHQGEADAGAAAAYEGNLTALVARHRGYVEAEITGSAAPFILGTMVQRWLDERSMNYVVDAIHRDIANLVPNADFADLSDLDQPGWPTTNHFLIDEYKVAGARYYAKWLAAATAMGW